MNEATIELADMPSTDGVGGSLADLDASTGLYVHWPFCKAKCPYCDFNSHVRDGVDHDLWCGSLLSELDHMASLGMRGSPGSIFFGGGTPSLMEPSTVQAIIERVRQLWPEQELEITLEANPTSVEAAKFRAFHDAGVNRVSIGLQSLNDDALRFLGREHSAKEGIAALELAASIFPRVSFDLIYARAGQTEASWLAELDQALAFDPGHLSLYQLTIEPGTKFHALYGRGALEVLSEDQQAHLFEVTQARLEEAGLAAYEISNHAKPGQQSRHNLVYWRYGDYLGVGPGAHGRIGCDGQKWATQTLRQPEAWLRSVRQNGHGLDAQEVLDAKEQVTEALMMGLRLSEGVPLERLQRLGGDRWQSLLDQRQVERAITNGLLLVEADPSAEPALIKATPQGRAVLDHLLGCLLR